MQINRFIVFASLIFLLISCKKSEHDTLPDTSSNYFPVKIGSVRIYKVDSIYWDPFFHTNDTISYEIKEVIAADYTDIEGRLTQQIDRYRRDSSTGEWYIWKIWHCNKTASTAEVVEDNVRYLKLIFPASLKSKWNGNIFNSGDEMEYEITSFNQPDDQTAIYYSNTLRVLQQDYIDSLQTQFGEERYSYGCGLIYRHNIFKERQVFSGPFTKGYDYTESLISFSN